MNVAVRPTGAVGYRLLRWIGASGAATVYAATELSSGRTTAIKLFHGIDSAGLARLEQLLHANARLSHTNIVRSHQIGRTADGRLFHAMPLLLGFERKRRDLLGRPLRIAALLRELLDGLGHAHRCGLLHGGIKPSNVLFDERGRAHLADFGIACCMADLGRWRSEAAGYLSPEQAHGDPPCPGSDVYSIGMLAYELLTGAPPVRGRGQASPATTQIGQLLPRLPARAGAWQAWIDQALAPSPERRFQTIEAMAEALALVDGQHPHHRAAATTERIHAPKPKTYAAAVVLAIVAVAAWTMWEHGPAPATGPVTEPAAMVPAGPAWPTTASVQPAPPLTTVPATTSLLARRAQGLVAAADALRARGQLLSPPFHNATSHYLAALALDPGNPAAIAGIDGMLATLRSRLAKAWDGRDTAEAVDVLRQGDALAKYASSSARRAWRNHRRTLARQVGGAMVQAARGHDARRIAALTPLAKALPARLPDGFDLADAKHVASAPKAGEHMQDRGGPPLVYVPATGEAPAFAIAQVEVTRADYAAFVRATHRPPAKCLEAHNPFSRLRHLTWQAPGFAQGSDHPVVCVSWDDATAYAAWLSKTTGQHYRLASSSQWLRAARGMPKGSPCKLGNVDDVSRQSVMDNDRWSCDDGAAQTAPVGHYAASAVGAYDLYGNVREWLSGGAPGARPFRGLSWRDGSHETALASQGTGDSNVGYTNVGFRVVRAIDNVHPALVASHQ